jgi:hypothetical protein
VGHFPPLMPESCKTDSSLSIVAYSEHPKDHNHSSAQLVSEQMSVVVLRRRFPVGLVADRRCNKIQTLDLDFGLLIAR